VSDTRKPNDEYVVIRHRPGYRLRRTMILLAFTVVAAIAGYAAGMAQGGFRFSSAEASNEQLAQELRSLRDQFRTARQNLVNLERGRAIDEQALREARNTIVGLETRISELEADLTFYRNIMAPSETSKGLQVDSFTLASARGDNTYRFKMVLTQVGNNNSFIAGQVAVNIIGRLDGEKEVIALRDLSDDIEDLGVRFRFRYFQDVEGTLNLPQGFEPYEIQVVAQAQGRNASQAERTFDWAQLTGS
jgi:Tfp pilus assembly protein PilO